MNIRIPDAVKEYLEAYRYRTELHAHTRPCSGCSELVPEDMLQYLHEQKYDAVVIVNHFYTEARFMKSEDPVDTYLEDFRKAKEIGKQYGIQVLLGAELRFTENENDYLVYGAEESLLREMVTQLDMGIEAFYQKYHSDSLLVIQAHPFRNGNVIVSPEYLDGVETMNMHPNHNSRVALVSRYAQANKVPIVTVGTDLHHKGHEGVCALRTKELPDSERKLVEILRSGDYLFEIGGCLMFPVPVL